MYFGTTKFRFFFENVIVFFWECVELHTLDPWIQCMYFGTTKFQAWNYIHYIHGYNVCPVGRDNHKIFSRIHQNDKR